MIFVTNVSYNEEGFSPNIILKTCSQIRAISIMVAQTLSLDHVSLHREDKY